MSALNRGVEAPDQIEALGINVYVSIPQSPTQTKMNKRLGKLVGRTSEVHDLLFLAVEAPADLVIEAMRGLRTSLNLAAILAQADQHMLVIDGDIRRGYLHVSMGVNSNCG